MNSIHFYFYIFFFSTKNIYLQIDNLPIDCLHVEKKGYIMEKRFLGLIEKSIKQHWDLPAFSDLEGQTLYYKDFARKIEELHILFEKSDIQKGDKIAIIGKNSSNWAVSFFAILSYGAVAVPILHEFTANSIHYLLNHSETKVLFIAEANWSQLDASLIPDIQLTIRLEDFSLIQSTIPNIENVLERLPELFKEKYPTFTPDSIHYYIENPEDMCLLNYTSGTTSSSKGVMLPYRSLWSNTKYAADNLPFIHAGDNFVCILPMAHMYGLAFEVLNGINKGCHINFITRMPSPQIILKAFAECKPTLILSVPIIIEKIVRTNIFPIIEKPVMKILLSIPGISHIIRKKILKQLNQAFGDNFEEIIIGGAPLNQEVEHFLRSIKFHYTVGYGMTECGPLVAYAKWDEYKAGSVGRVVDRMNVRIDSPNDMGVGEIFVKGANNMLGYYKNPEETSAVMKDDGWMKTGDLGIIDSDGHIFIRGRSKTMILGPNGQNIYPEEIEIKLNSLPLVVESLIISDNKKLTALIYPDWDYIKKTKMTSNDVNDIMKQNLKLLNHSIPKYCKVALFEIREEEFEKTPKKSIKRFLYQPQL